MKNTNMIVKVPVLLVVLLVMLAAAFTTACMPLTNTPGAGAATQTQQSVDTATPQATPAVVATNAPQKPVPSPTIATTAAPQATATATSKSSQIIYKNTKLGFLLVLPQGWKGYTIVTDQWDGYDAATGKKTESGPKISIRNPKWTAKNPYQDIPIMVFTLSQWKLVQKETLSVSAAPIGPSELGRNSKYVFALPARYNYAYPAGYKEVESYLAGKPLQPFTPGSK